MNEIAQTSTGLAVPASRVNLSFRVGTMDDIDEIDALQKQYSKQLGFFPRMQLEGYIKGGWVLIAEEVRGQKTVGSGQDSSLPTAHCPPPTRTPVGFIASRDRYFKRDECGIVYLLCVKPGAQRKFVGAALLREVFNRSPYGCRLYSCWCAQDIEANYFWESMGFVPLAYRNGAEKKGPKGPDGKRTQRVHIFWQKKIRENDTITPWWFPSKTEGGAMGAERLAFPIPPGVHWRDVKAMEIGKESAERKVPSGESKSSSALSTQHSVLPPRERKKKSDIPAKPATITMGRMGAPLPPKPAVQKTRKAQTKERVVYDPKLKTAARELRDRYLEQVNERGYRLESAGKYDLVREQLGVESRELRERNGLPLSTLNPQLSTDTKLLDAA